VSEETGKISYSVEGKLVSKASVAELKSFLVEEFSGAGSAEKDTEEEE
jgi:hypothetical protein